MKKFFGFLTGKGKDKDEKKGGGDDTTSSALAGGSHPINFSNSATGPSSSPVLSSSSADPSLVSSTSFLTPLGSGVGAGSASSASRVSVSSASPMGRLSVASTTRTMPTLENVPVKAQQLSLTLQSLMLEFIRKPLADVILHRILAFLPDMRANALHIVIPSDVQRDFLIAYTARLSSLLTGRGSVAVNERYQELVHFGVGAGGSTGAGAVGGGGISFPSSGSLSSQQIMLPSSSSSSAVNLLSPSSFSGIFELIALFVAIDEANAAHVQQPLMSLVWQVLNGIVTADLSSLEIEDAKFAKTQETRERSLRREGKQSAYKAQVSASSTSYSSSSSFSPSSPSSSSSTSSRPLPSLPRTSFVKGVGAGAGGISNGSTTPSSSSSSPSSSTSSHAPPIIIMEDSSCEASSGNDRSPSLMGTSRFTSAAIRTPTAVSSPSSSSSSSSSTPDVPSGRISSGGIGPRSFRGRQRLAQLDNANDDDDNESSFVGRDFFVYESEPEYVPAVPSATSSSSSSSLSSSVTASGSSIGGKQFNPSSSPTLTSITSSTSSIPPGGLYDDRQMTATSSSSSHLSSAIHGNDGLTSPSLDATSTSTSSHV